MQGSSEIRLCPAEDMIPNFSKKFENYKKAEYEIDEMLSDRRDSNDDIKRRVDVDTLGGEQDEFTKQMVCHRRILRSQELGREDKIKIKVQALTRPEFENFTPEQL